MEQFGLVQVRLCSQPVFNSSKNHFNEGEYLVAGYKWACSFFQMPIQKYRNYILFL